jgi:hypothetical protein
MTGREQEMNLLRFQPEPHNMNERPMRNSSL